jgi:hypothetical protein
MNYDTSDSDFQSVLERVRSMYSIDEENITHIIVTHFNIRFHVPHRGREIKRTWKRPLMKEPFAKEYMDSRIKLFENFCYPSMLNQTSQNFHWFVYFDRETPLEWYCKFDRIIPIYLYGDECFSYKKHLINEVLRRDMLRDKKWIIYTKLDNDDSLSKDWVEDLQKTWIPVTRSLHMSHSFVNYNDGLLFIKRDKNRYLFNHKDRYNPFVNSLERVTKESHKGDMVTSNICTHNQMLGSIYPQKVIRASDPRHPMYLINDQKHNLCNRNNKINDGKNTKKSLEYIEEYFGIKKECLK